MSRYDSLKLAFEIIIIQGTLMFSVVQTLNLDGQDSNSYHIEICNSFRFNVQNYPSQCSQQNLKQPLSQYKNVNELSKSQTSNSQSQTQQVKNNTVDRIGKLTQ